MAIAEIAPDELVRWLSLQRGEASEAIRALAAAWPPPQHAAAHARVIEELTDYHDAVAAALDALGVTAPAASPRPGGPWPKTARPGTTRWVIRRYFALHPGPANAAAILDWVAAGDVEWTTVTDRPRAAMNMCLGHLRAEGELERLDRGVYRPVPVPPGTGQ